MVMVHRGKVLQSLKELEGDTANARQNIVHVIDIAEVKRDTVRFRLKGLGREAREYAVGAETKVGDFVKQHLARVDQLPHFYVSLVYAGRVMAAGKSFFEQLVEEGCEITAVNLLQAVKAAAAESRIKSENGNIVQHSPKV